MRTGSASAIAMACSFQPSASSRSIARQMIHARHRGADQVLGDRTHRVGRLVGVADEHVDHRQIGLDRGLHPAVAGDDHQPVAVLRHP